MPQAVICSTSFRSSSVGLNGGQVIRLAFLGCIFFYNGESLPATLQFSLFTSEILPALHDNIAVSGVKFHKPGVATVLLGCDHRGAGTAEAVQN